MNTITSLDKPVGNVTKLAILGEYLAACGEAGIYKKLGAKYGVHPIRINSIVRAAGY